MFLVSLGMVTIINEASDVFDLYQHHEEFMTMDMLTKEQFEEFIGTVNNISHPRRDSEPGREKTGRKGNHGQAGHHRP